MRLDEKEEQLDELIAVTGKSPRTVRRTGAAVLAVMLAGVVWAIASMTCGVASSGCSPASLVSAPTVDARSEARAAVLTAAEGLKIGADICAQVVTQTHNEPLRTACLHALSTSGEGLRLAADIVDAWTDAERGLFACALTDALQGLRDTSTALSDAAGVSELPQIAAVLALLPAWLPACTRAVDAGVTDATSSTTDGQVSQ